MLSARWGIGTKLVRSRNVRTGGLHLLRMLVIIVVLGAVALGGCGRTDLPTSPPQTASNLPSGKSTPSGVELSTATAAITVSSTVVGTTPEVLGYNLAHTLTDSNVRDWWRYSGVKAARVFLSASDIEATDDLVGTGDGVGSQSAFEARRAALRANAADPAQALDSQYVNWSQFEIGYSTMASGNNRFVVNQAFPMLRGLGVDILVNVTASPSRFPLGGSTDYANLWELWQHYYAQAFMLSRDYQVRRFSMFNEPNGWSPAITVEDWALRLRVCSDAIQSAVADMNSRYGRALSVEVLAPNTANGATKYDDPADYWGRQAITERGQGIWSVAPPDWSNLHVYNYQKYSMLTDSTATSSGYVNDFDDLRSKIAADMSGTPLPLALTEYNVRTGLNYDGRVETADSPSDYVALGANSIALAERGARQLYLFKFGMTERASPTNYPVAKNGTHYVQNSTAGVNNYGGSAATAEVYRLFVKAAGQSRERLQFSSTLGNDVRIQVTRDTTTGAIHVFVANRNTTAVTFDVDLAALAVDEGSLVTVEEVSEVTRGAVALFTTVNSGRIPALSMPAQSVRLFSIYDGATTAPTQVVAAEDAVLRDGSKGRRVTGSTTNPLLMRADGTTSGRRVSLLKFAVPTYWNGTHRVLLVLNASTTSGNTPIQAHLYGLHDDSWNEASITFAGLNTALLQNVGSGSLIANNVVANQGSTTEILGQLVANSTTREDKVVDVTDFIIRQSDGYASFLLVQDHRWDVKLPEKTAGDIQPAGIAITSREGSTKPRLLIYGGAVVGTAPTIVQQPSAQTVVAGNSATFAVQAAGDPPFTYQWRKDGTAIAGASAASYVIAATTSADGGNYSVVVTNPYGTVISASATLTVTSSTGTPIVAEFENLARAASSGDAIRIEKDAKASGGKSLLFRASSVGDYLTLALDVPTAGSYAVSFTAKMQSDRGIFQLKVADTLAGPYLEVDTPKDEYRSSITFGSVGAFTQRVIFTTPGTKYLRFEVTGRNVQSSGYYLSLDKLTLTP